MPARWNFRFPGLHQTDRLHASSAIKGPCYVALFHRRLSGSFCSAAVLARRKIIVTTLATITMNSE